MNNDVSYQIFGEAAILFNWKSTVSPLINDEVLALESHLVHAYQEHILETVPAYNSLAVYLKKEVNPIDFLSRIDLEAIDLKMTSNETKKLVTIPVCYASQFAPDMEKLCNQHKLTEKEVIAIHTAPHYRIYFLGFLPGFPYMGGLDSRLHTSRKSTPRQFIEAGSVAIGGSQTGIYTVNSPGGWNIIGKSPLLFFASEKNPAALLRAGDYVQFRVISSDEFTEIRQKVISETYMLEQEVLHD